MNKLPNYVICTCLLCKAETVVNDFGQNQPGKYVSITTRTVHRQRDRGQPVAHIPPMAPIQVISVAPLSANGCVINHIFCSKQRIMWFHPIFYNDGRGWR